MSTYHYKALDIQKGEIRLLYLLPGSCADPVKLHIIHVPFSNAREFKYDALSYAWGSEEDLQPVQLSRLSRPNFFKRLRRPTEGPKTLIDEVDAGTLFVTRNLFAALRTLRQPDRQLRLWIDAICIDQGNTKEKAREVNRMGDIYQKAISVLVWLGLASHDSDLAMDTLKSMVSRAKSLEDSSDWGRAQGKVTREGNPYPSDEELQARTRAISTLLLRPWFSRLWIWQELILTARPIMICGGVAMPYGDFSRCILMATGHLPHGEALAGCMNEKSERILLRMAYFPRQAPDLPAILESTRYSMCKDPRDRIFALRGLMAYNIRDHIIPDYDKTPQDVFKHVVLTYIRLRGSLELLTWCEMPLPSDWRSSWVPDFGTPRMTSSITFTAASSLSEAVVAESDGTNIRLEGVQATVIAEIMCVFQKEGNLRDSILRFQNLVHDLFMVVDEESQKIELTVSLIALATCSQYSLEYIDCCGSFTHEGMRQSFVELLKTDLSTISFLDLLQLRIVPYAAENFSGRAIFKTCGGHLGLGPSSAQVGDRVCVLLGSNVPFLLRPICGTFNNCQMVGMTFIREFMDKQALLGPLPPSVVAWWSFSDGHSSPFYYYNNVATEEDPRLPPLPPGYGVYDLEVYPNSSSAAPGFETLPTVRRRVRRPNGVCFDPRMSAKSLRSRGVPLKTFVLV